MMKKAFTLSELLISLSIVGIIAILTLPNIFGSANNRANVAKLQTTFTQVQDAIQQAMLEEKVSDWMDTEYGAENTSSSAIRFLKDYLEVIKDCGDSYVGCFADSYGEINKTRKRNNFYREDAFVLLKNGAAVAFRQPYSVGSSAYLVIDVNGIAGPNVLGRDLFVMWIDKNGLTRGDNGNLETLDEFAQDCKTWSGYFTSCFQYLLLNNWKMDY